MCTVPVAPEVIISENYYYRYELRETLIVNNIIYVHVCNAHIQLFIVAYYVYACNGLGIERVLHA